MMTMVDVTTRLLARRRARKTFRAVQIRHRVTEAQATEVQAVLLTTLQAKKALTLLIHQQVNQTANLHEAQLPLRKIRRRNQQAKKRDENSLHFDCLS